jgi:hypothetical protein
MCGYREMKMYVCRKEEEEFSDAAKQEGRDISTL